MDGENSTWRQEVMWDGNGKRSDMGKKMVCEVTPHIMLNSHGVFEKWDSGSGGMALWEYPLPQLEIIILSTFLFWRFFDSLFKKLGVPIPRFTSMMLVGAILSEAFHPIHLSWFQHMFIKDDDDHMPKVAETVGAFAFVLDWFLRGVTTDVGMIRKSGTKCVVIGITSMIIPWQIGRLLYSSRQKSSILQIMSDQEYSIITFTMSITPFTCVNMFLTDLKIINTEFGQITQSSGMITDMLAFCINVLGHVSRDPSNGMRMGVSLVVFLIFLYIVRQAMLWVIRHTPEGVPVKNAYLYIGLLLAYLSHIFWSHYLFFGPLGAFVLGLVIPNGPPLGSLFMQRFNSFNEGIFLPLFGSLSMLKLDWKFLINSFDNGNLLEGPLYEFFSLIFLLYVAKFTTSFLAALGSKIPLRDSIILGFIMGTKSSFELAYLLIAFEKDRICKAVFTLMGIYIFANSLCTPLTIHFLYDRSKRFVSYGKRCLRHKPQLQLLMCINRPDNITSMISLLRATSPSRNSPMTCCVLHLIELLGKATPTFISHQLQKPKPGSRSYSENVISSFQLFQDIYGGSATINMFTSLTFTKDMHEHICWFALDKSSNLILLSFHRIWGPNGIGIISDDHNLRRLNRNVLKRAPCSVGLFVYRKPLWQPKCIESPCRTCLIYVGGDDDKEALALADHMKGNEQVSLTVLRLIPASHPDESGKRSEIQVVNRNGDRPRDDYATYIDWMVADGTETSKILHSVAYDYDLFLVGRRSGVGTPVTRGLGDWMEFEELGIIGDLLASEYYPSKASVLVVQQQE